MKYIWKKIFLHVFLVSLVLSSGAQDKTDTLKVLFVGNSYTYFWNLPQTVEAMAISQEVPLIARQSTAGGTNWKQHWEGDKGLQSKSLIEEGDWDVVVLQNHSMSTINDLDQFMTFGSELIALVRSVGAEPILYETWARDFNPLMLTSVKAGYEKLAEKEKVQIVRVGELWAKSKELRPDMNLYDPDKSHPSPIGTYLTATAFYSFLTGKSSRALENRIIDVDRNGQKLYLSIMSKDNALYMQQLVNEMVTEKLTNAK